MYADWILMGGRETAIKTFVEPGKFVFWMTILNQYKMGGGDNDNKIFY